MKGSIYAAIFWLVITSIGVAEEMKEIGGVVVDENGEVAEQVELAPKWQVRRITDRPEYRAQTPESIGSGTTGSDGVFSFSMQKGWWTGLLAYDKDRRRGAVTAIPADEAPQNIELQLKPLVRVKYHIVETLPDVVLQHARLSFSFAPAAKMRQGQVLSHFSPVQSEVLLPPGEYNLDVSAGQKWGRINQTITVSDDCDELDLGNLVLPPVKWAAFPEGKAPELEHTMVRGVPEEFSLGGLKGKWVLLNFWASWCGPCHRDMVDLLKMENSFPRRSEVAEIVMIDCSGQKDFSVTDQKMPEIANKYWQGQIPKFPMVLDGKGQIRQTYGVRLLPTKILIDPDGKVVTKSGGPDAVTQLTSILKARAW